MRRLVGFVVIGMFLAAAGVAIAAAYFTLFDSSGSSKEQTTGGPTATLTPGTPQTTVECATPVLTDTIRSRLAPPSAGPRAVIIDEASLTAPNPAFAEAAMALLQQAGYVVDYYAGGDVTVDFFRNLPAQNYGFIIFRGHSVAFFDNLVLFTDEPYSKDAHVDDQRSGRLVEVHWNAECIDEPRFFGIMPEFIENLDGGFDGATVLITGCWGLDPNTTAAAFVKKGAGVVVGWDGLVLANHTDAATERLLQHLLVDRLPASEAVGRTMAEIGPDPEYGSTLGVYPAEE